MKLGSKLKKDEFKGGRPNRVAKSYTRVRKVKIDVDENNKHVYEEEKLLSE